MIQLCHSCIAATQQPHCFHLPRWGSFFNHICQWIFTMILFVELLWTALTWTENHPSAYGHAFMHMLLVRYHWCSKLHPRQGHLLLPPTASTTQWKIIHKHHGDLSCGDFTPYCFSPICITTEVVLYCPPVVVRRKLKWFIPHVPLAFFAVHSSSACARPLSSPVWSWRVRAISEEPLDFWGRPR